MSDNDNGNEGGAVGPRAVVDLQPKDELRGVLNSAQRNLPILLEHVKLQAKLRRASYLAYLKEGFTEVQALELCKG